MIFYPVVGVFWLLFRFLFRWRITGLENIPAGGAIIAPNHQSMWDIPLVGLALCKRRNHFMAKSELFRNPIFGWIIRTLLAFPVKRGAPDRAAIRRAVELLKQGELVTIFPEGTRSKTGKLKEAEAGLSLIAAKADVPVVPVGIDGTRRIFSKTCWFPRVKIAFGRPVHIIQNESGKPEDVGFRVMEAIGKLMDNESP